MLEVFASLAGRYTGQTPDEDGRNYSGPFVETELVDDTFTSLVSEGVVTREIRKQDASKTCDIESIHMRVIKALLPSYYSMILCRPFKLCLSTGISPPAWSLSVVHMMTT